MSYFWRCYNLLYIHVFIFILVNYFRVVVMCFYTHIYISKCLFMGYYKMPLFMFYGVYSALSNFVIYAFYKLLLLFLLFCGLSHDQKQVTGVTTSRRASIGDWSIHGSSIWMRFFRMLKTLLSWLCDVAPLSKYIYINGCIMNSPMPWCGCFVIKNIRTAETLAIFKKYLKTHLFAHAFDKKWHYLSMWTL